MIHSDAKRGLDVSSSLTDSGHTLKTNRCFSSPLKNVLWGVQNLKSEFSHRRTLYRFLPCVYIPQRTFLRCSVNTYVFQCISLDSSSLMNSHLLLCLSHTIRGPAYPLALYILELTGVCVHYQYELITFSLYLFSRVTTHNKNSQLFIISFYLHKYSKSISNFIKNHSSVY
jgi:hypothetical protein